MESISVAVDTIFSFGPIPITNAQLGGILVTAGLILFTIFVRRGMSIVPSRAQVMLEMLTDYLLSLLKNAFGSEARARKFFPIMMTVLLFLIVANQFSLVPLITQIVAGNTPVFRVPTSNLALTVGLALAVVAAANILAFTVSPIRHIQQFIVIKPILSARTPSAFGLALIDFFLGFLNIISEFAKVFSLSFRLFGNIFAGEVMVIVIAGLSAYTHFIVPIPFVALSIFSGFIQAFVFVLLSIQYIAGSIASVEQAEPKTA